MGPLMPVDDALELLLEGAVCRAGVERIDIRRAAGRVAAKAVSAAINVPTPLPMQGLPRGLPSRSVCGFQPEPLLAL